MTALYFSGRPTTSVVARLRQNMESSLNEDLLKIVEWGKLNRVEFNANKTQCCLLTHKRIDGFDQRTNMAGVDVTQNNCLHILGMHLQSDLRWGAHIFEVAKKAAQCLGFLKRCKRYFSSNDLLNIYNSYIRPNEWHYRGKADTFPMQYSFLTS